MSVASSIPYIKIPNPSSSSPSSCSSLSSSSSTSSTSSYYRFSPTTKPYIVTIRSSQAEGPVRRPVAPPLREPSPPASPSPPLKPVPPSSPSSPVAPPPKPAARVALEDKNVITLEFQRQKAKELQEYFKKKKLEEADQGPFFGFFGKNEIANGRWAMFGFAVGMLTEYATGSDFVDQVKILLSNFGILDLE
ncbi:MYB-LIKE PROTEIN U [Salix koriyanagi]|uniref:MYB-LIKE PROTEIN U n=1 Tax=Salix koriyanagi TaxID=2511006 RepID=A0A9Q0P4R7_9ROSI|nr:MYB-LIKE PROTEIN U [Salix koriyanagi]